jgi:hypothetical protein
MINLNETSNRQQSEFNFAISYLGRLNYWFYVASFSSAELDAHNWFYSLMNIYRELSTEMTEDEIKLFDSKILQINNNLSLNQKMKNKKGVPYISNELYLVLHKFELDLRKITKDSGIQMKMKDDAMTALR